MIRTMVHAQTVLFASTAMVLAQTNAPQSAPQKPPPPQVFSQTGTMYNGANANLQLPPEPNKYWLNLWAAPI
jgi:hypothetical protein